MIRASLYLMLVFNLENDFAKSLGDWIEKRRRDKKFFINFVKVDNKALTTRPGTHDLSKEVDKSLRQAEAAVVVLSKDDSVSAKIGKKKEYVPRPNVCYEMGFLFSRLDPQRITLLIDSTKDKDWIPKQPSDVINLHKPQCLDLGSARTLVNNLLTNLGATEQAHGDWGSSFDLRDFREFPTLESYSHWIINQVKLAKNPRTSSLGWKLLAEHGQFLLDELGPNTLEIAALQLRKPSASDIDGFQAFHICTAMQAYWATKVKSGKKDLLRQVEENIDQISQPIKWQVTIENQLLRVLYCDYRGLLCESRNQVSPAASWYKDAINEADKLGDDLRVLWLGYIKFNLARMSEKLTEPKRVNRLYNEACIHRSDTYDRASGTIIENGRRCQLAIALGMYLRWLRKHRESKLLDYTLKEYKSRLAPLLEDPAAPRSAMHARARFSLLGDNLDKVPKRKQWDIPPHAKSLVDAAIEYHQKVGPILAGGYAHRLMRRS